MGGYAPIALTYDHQGCSEAFVLRRDKRDAKELEFETLTMEPDGLERVRNNTRSASNNGTMNQ